jgi:hypothetical protein
MQQGMGGGVASIRVSSSIRLASSAVISSKRVLWFGIFLVPIPSCDACYRAVMRSWFAIWFANFSLAMRAF